MESDLKRLGVDSISGVANFILAFLPEDGPTAAEVVRDCRKQGVHLRDVSNMGVDVSPHAVRIAVKSPEDNHRILKAIDSAICMNLEPALISPVDE
jgi:histidinol-phosphate/aromatic aminotransferase/cobyric acid decarboxylase-like protein